MKNTVRNAVSIAAIAETPSIPIAMRAAEAVAPVVVVVGVAVTASRTPVNARSAAVVPQLPLKAEQAVIVAAVVVAVHAARRIAAHHPAEAVMAALHSSPPNHVAGGVNVAA